MLTLRRRGGSGRSAARARFYHAGRRSTVWIDLRSSRAVLDQVGTRNKLSAAGANDARARSSTVECSIGSLQCTTRDEPMCGRPRRALAPACRRLPVTHAESRARCRLRDRRPSRVADRRAEPPSVTGSTSRAHDRAGAAERIRRRLGRGRSACTCRSRTASSDAATDRVGIRNVSDLESACESWSRARRAAVAILRDQRSTRGACRRSTRLWFDRIVPAASGGSCRRRLGKHTCGLGRALPACREDGASLLRGVPGSTRSKFRLLRRVDHRVAHGERTSERSGDMSSEHPAGRLMSELELAWALAVGPEARGRRCGCR